MLTKSSQFFSIKKGAVLSLLPGGGLGHLDMSFQMSTEQQKINYNNK